MKTHTRILRILLISLLPLIASCVKSNEGIKPPATEAERTVLVYMVASNNLSGFANSDLREMRQAAADGHLQDGRLLVYHVASGAAPVLKEVTPTRVDTLKVYDQAQSAVTVAQMRQVLDDTKKFAKAKDYGIVLWSHASGWLQDGITDADDPALGMSHYSYGSDRGKKMNISALATALEGQDLSFAYFDCCFMGSIEVMYELRKAVPVMIASATEVPADGMPYNKTLRYLFDKQPDYAAAARTTFDSYNDVFVDGNCPCTMAVVRSEYLDELAELTAEIYDKALESMPKGYKPQRYSYESTDYYSDFEDYVRTICNDESLLNKWQACYDNLIEYKAATPSVWNLYSTFDVIPITRFGGLSTYILEDKDDAFAKTKYWQLQWYADVASKLFKDVL